MMRLSIRQRLTAWYAAALLLGLVVFALQHVGLAPAAPDRPASMRASHNAFRACTALGAEPEIRDRDQPPQGTRRVHTRNPRWQSRAAARRLRRRPLASPASRSCRPPAGRTAPYTEVVAGRQLRIATTRLESAGSVFEAQVAIPLDEILGVMQDFRQLLLLLIPAVLIVSCLGGYWLSSRALRPVDEITTVARSIGVQNLSQRIAVPRPATKLSAWPETWNDILERLETVRQAHPPIHLGCFPRTADAARLDSRHRRVGAAPRSRPRRATAPRCARSSRKPST